MKPLSCAPLRRGAAVACFVWGPLSAVWAQVAPLNEPATPPQAPTPAPTSPAVAAVPVARPPVQPRFDVLEFVVEGNTVLPEALVERTVAPFLGEAKQFSDVEGARIALEKVYQDAGFLTVFVDLPEQNITHGVVTLRVQEGKVERLTVSGSRYYAQGYIRDRVPELAEGRVPNFNVVQAQLTDVNRTEDRRVQPVLRPGRQPNSAEVELKVTDQLPWHGTVELNNNHGQFSKPWRAMLMGRYDNLFQLDHSLQVLALTAPADPKETKALGLTYTVPLPGGDSWSGSVMWSDSQLEALGSAQILGRGTIVGVKRLWSLPGSGGVSHTLTVGPEFKDMKERTLVGSDQLSTPLRYMPLTLAYGGAWQQEDGGLTLWNHSLVMGVDKLLKRDIDCGFGPQDQFACKRDGADGGFAYLRLDARHTQPVGRSKLALHIGGQLATQALVGGEQFSLGGADNVRGYLSAEAVGDHGYWGSVQWQTPELLASLLDAPPAEGRQHELTGYAFADAGRVQVINASAAQKTRQTVAAVGLGLNARAWKRWALTVDLARALKSAAVTHSGDKRIHARLSADF